MDILQPKLPMHNFWKLIDVLDSETNTSKVHTKALYGTMMNNVTSSFAYDEKSELSDLFRLNIEFLYKEHPLHALLVEKVTEDDFKLFVHTLNPIYIFEIVEKFRFAKSNE